MFKFVDHKICEIDLSSIENGGTRPTLIQRRINPKTKGKKIIRKIKGYADTLKITLKILR